MQNTDTDRQWMRFDARRVTLGLTREDLLRLFTHLLRARRTDERLVALRLRGLLTGGPSCHGHEAAQVGCVTPLAIGKDYLLPYYRDLAAMLAIGMTPTMILLNQFGRSDDPISGARMRPAQWNSRALNVVSASGMVATQILHAAGIAFAAKLRGEPVIAMTFFGEGATSEGDFHEALNFAGLHQLGVVFVCENNGIALSTPQSLQMAVQRVADRAAGYGMPGVVVDGADIFAVIDAALEAITRARNGQGPTLIEIIIPHLSTKKNAQGDYEGRDPVALFRDYLRARGDITDEQMQHLYEQIEAELDEAERIALAAAPPDTAQVGNFVFAEMGRNNEPAADDRVPDVPTQEGW